MILWHAKKALFLDILKLIQKGNHKKFKRIIDIAWDKSWWKKVDINKIQAIESLT